MLSVESTEVVASVTLIKDIVHIIYFMHIV